MGVLNAAAAHAWSSCCPDATSSLDTATEAQIAAALTATMEGRTRLIVTHRMATAAGRNVIRARRARGRKRLVVV